MLAARIHEDGGPEVVRVEEVPDPVAGSGRGARPAPRRLAQPSRRLGAQGPARRCRSRASSERTAPASSRRSETALRGLAVGQRVVINPGLVHGDRVTVVGEHFDGTHAELIAIAAEQVFPLDDDISFETAAAFPLVFETAYRMLVTREAIREGNWALIWGIGGGVATASFEICRAFGVNTIVTSGSPEKLATAREWGADVVLDHHADDVVAAVKEATGAGVDVVVETVGEATWARSLAAVRPFGRVVVCGATTGPNPPAQLHRMWWKQLTVIGSTMGTREDFLGRIRARARRPGPGPHRPRLPARRGAAAHARLEAGEQLGKIVLAIPG